MNKTVNINLGGIFFHIDEIAYQKLKRYIDAIRRSLSDDPKGRDEIISDIELRIGELLSEKVRDIRQVVSESDIEEVITVMGQPEDYLVDEELFTEETKRSYNGSSSRRKQSKGKKLFRDSDDKFLGGVSSGIAYYFDVDVIWVRVAWIIALFGLGIGPILYIILWILLPEAKTTADKLQMEGEPVNISNIEKRVRSEFEDASARIRDAANEVGGKVKEGIDNVSDSLKKKRVSSNTKSGLQDFIEVVGNIITTFFKIIGKFIGIILIMTSIIALITLVISLFTAGAVGFMGIDTIFNEGVQVMNPTGIPTWIISIIALILIGIPFLMLFFLGLFIISNESKAISRTGKFVLLGIWVIALLASIYIGLRQGAEFANQGTVTESTTLYLEPVDTLTIKMSNVDDFLDGETVNRKFGFRYIYDENDDEKFFFTDISVDVKVSDSTEAYIKVRKKARGRSRELAKENASMIDYDFKMSDEILMLDEYFLTDTKFPFRDQDLYVTICIPEGKPIYFDKSTRRFIKHNIRTTNDMYNRDMPGQKFIMTEDGLQCLDCRKKGKKNEDGWIYEDNSDADNEDDKKGLKVKVNEDGIEIKIKDDGEKAEVKIDESGLRIN